jgi:soluble lytic murein transglycosylase-like protein
MQLLQDIGRAYGLRIDKKVDERTHPIAVEKAGIPILDKYMKRYDGNLILTIIAWNAGQTKADNVVSKYGLHPEWGEIKGELQSVHRVNICVESTGKCVRTCAN